MVASMCQSCDIVLIVSIYLECFQFCKGRMGVNKCSLNLLDDTFMFSSDLIGKRPGLDFDDKSDKSIKIMSCIRIQ